MARSATKQPRRTSLLPPKAGPKREKRAQGYARQVSAILISLAVGPIIGFALVWFFGEWLPPGRPVLISNVGSIEEIRLPEGARKLEDVGAFMIKGGGGDDFRRIYVNNYLVNSGESPSHLFFNEDAFGKQARNIVIKYAINRNNYMVADKDVMVFLKHGDNYIAQELENSIFGTCVAGINIEVNGSVLEHFPQVMPKNFYVEPGVSNSNKILADKFQQSGVGALSDALCARRVYHFNLE